MWIRKMDIMWNRQVRSRYCVHKIMKILEVNQTFATMLFSWAVLFFLISRIRLNVTVYVFFVLYILFWRFQNFLACSIYKLLMTQYIHCCLYINSDVRFWTVPFVIWIWNHWSGILPIPSAELGLFFFDKNSRFCVTRSVHSNNGPSAALLLVSY